MKILSVAGIFLLTLFSGVLLAEDPTEIERFRKIYGQFPSELNLISPKRFDAEMKIIRTNLEKKFKVDPNEQTRPNYSPQPTALGFDLKWDESIKENLLFVVQATYAQGIRSEIAVKSLRMTGVDDFTYPSIKCTDEKKGALGITEASLYAKNNLLLMSGTFSGGTAIRPRSNTVVVYNFSSGTKIMDITPKLAYSPLRNFVVSPDGKFLAEVGQNSITLHDLSKREEVTGRLPTAWGKTTAAAFSPKSDKLAVGYESGDISVFEMDTGKELTKFIHDKSPKPYGTNPVLSLKFPENYTDPEAFFSSTHDYIYQWNTKSPKWVKKLESPPNEFGGANSWMHPSAPYPQGGFLVCYGGNRGVNSVMLLSLRDGKSIDDFPTTSPLKDIQFTADGKFMVFQLQYKHPTIVPVK